MIINTVDHMSATYRDKPMIDIDWLHASMQYPAAVVLIALGAAMAIRVRQIRHDDNVHADFRITMKLAVLLGLLGVKQLYWTVWGALRALDRFREAESFGSQLIIPFAINVLTIILGLMVMRRVIIIAYGPRSAVTMTCAVVALISIMQVVLSGKLLAQ